MVQLATQSHQLRNMKHLSRPSKNKILSANKMSILRVLVLNNFHIKTIRAIPRAKNTFPRIIWVKIKGATNWALLQLNKKSTSLNLHNSRVRMLILLPQSPRPITIIQAIILLLLNHYQKQLQIIITRAVIRHRWLKPSHKKHSISKHKIRVPSRAVVLASQTRASSTAFPNLPGPTS